MVYVLCACLLKCIFMKFGISLEGGGGSVTDLIRPICKIGCILGNFAKKALNLAQIGCFSAENGIIEGSQNCVFLGIENSDFLESGRHIHVQNLGALNHVQHLWKYSSEVSITQCRPMKSPEL